jgi:glycosyltransferase involved in cell wall biosynthesis
MTAVRSTKILQIVGAMNQGGVETWLMHVLRGIDRERFQIDFLVHTNQPAAYDAEIRQLGSRIIPCTNPRLIPTYWHNLTRILCGQNRYDVVHSHVYYFSGLVLRIASEADVPLRIAHSHTAGLLAMRKISRMRRLYFRWMRRWIEQSATLGLTASTEAAIALWGPNWQRETRWRTLYCGINLKPFERLEDRTALRAQLNIPRDALVLGHVGNFNHVKNHAFLVKIMHEMAQRHANARLLLIGSGPLQSDVEQLALAYDVRDRIIFLGSRHDVPRILLNCVDVFVFPSLYEGLPVSVLEAQAAGLPVIIADTITREVEVVPSLMTWLPLSQPPAQWANACLAAHLRHTPDMQAAARRALEHSAFNITHGIRELEAIYASSHCG